MPTHRRVHRALLVPALGVALAATLAACSSSSSSPSSAAATTSSSAPASASAATAAASSPAAPSASASASPAFTGAAAAIAKNWAEFFKGTTPASTRETLVQDGPKFAAALQGMASSTASKAASASVQSVTLTSSKQATVGYTVLVSGTPMLTGQKGTAVLEDGTWKVSLASFCGLLTLENGGKPVAGCPSS